MLKLFSINLFALYYAFIGVQVELAAIIKDVATCEEYPCLIFKDDFDTLDFKTWEHLKTAAFTGNKEFQYYTNNRTNSYIKNGSLLLKPTLTNDTFDEEFLYSGKLDLWGNSPYSQCSSNQYSGCLVKGHKNSLVSPIQSAAVRTVKSFSFKYGRINIRAKLPRGDWIWPAIWLMPKYSIYGEWPASGEIDLMESRGNDNYRDNDEEKSSVGNDHVLQSLHWGPYFPENRHDLTEVHTRKKKDSFADEYNVFSLDWTPDCIRFYINNQSTLNVTAKKDGFWKLGEFSKLFENIHNPWESGSNLAPFDQEFYLIMNLAVGGNNGYFHENFTPKMPWDNEEGKVGKLMKQFWEARTKWLPTWKGEDTALKIDYVEIWKDEKHVETKKETESSSTSTKSLKMVL